MIRLKASDGLVILFWDCEDYRIWTWKAHPPDGAVVEVLSKENYAKVCANKALMRLEIR
jgi:hypothetical protein